MEDITKIVKSREESELLIKGISETIKNEVKEQKGGFLPVLLVTLAASMLGRALIGRGVIIAGEDTIRADETFWCRPSFKQTLKYKKYYQHEPKFNSVYVKNNLSKIKDGANIIYLN